MAKILTVIGARPQFIKAAAVSRCIASTPDITEVLVHTGQHYDVNMSGVFFDEMGIPEPKHHLDVAGGSHGQMTGRMLEKIEITMMDEKPDVVLIYGDTNSTIAAALAAAKIHIPVAHVEAGLRSFNRAMPEEINRIMTDHISELLFTPTQTATDNLKIEGIPSEKIIHVGDVMYDAALYFGKIVEKNLNPLKITKVTPQKYILATIHRQENTDNIKRLEAIFTSLSKVAEETPVVLPLHPRTKARLSSANLHHLTENLIIVSPMGYLDMVAHEKSAAVIVTDSGGVQKEAFFYGVPCVTLRDETEWVELVDSGWNHLVSPVESEVIVSSIKAAIGSTGKMVTPYGNGNASEKIVDNLRSLALKR